MSTSLIGWQLTESVSGTLYGAISGPLNVDPEDAPGTRFAKIAESSLVYPLFVTPLFTLVMLVEAIVRVPLALVAKTLSCFIPKRRFEKLDEFENQSFITQLKRQLIGGPMACVSASIASIEHLLSQFGCETAAKVLCEANRKLVAPFRQPTIFSLQDELNTIELSLIETEE